MARRRIRVVVALSVLTALSLAAGCSSDGGGTGAAPSGGVQPTGEPVLPSVLPSPTSTAYVALPLDAYTFTEEQSNTVLRADGLLTQDCMRRNGFTDWAPAPPSTAGQKSLAANYPYRPVSSGDAAGIGYRKPPPPASTAGTTRRPPSDAEHLALNGFIPGKSEPPGPLGGGCTREASEKLSQGQPAADLELPARLYEQSSQRAATDSRVQAANAQWSACMAKSGLTYASPQEPATKDWGGKQAAQEEIRTATADVRCRSEANVIGVWISVLAAYQEPLVEANVQALQAAKASLDYKVKQAARIVAAQP